MSDVSSALACDRKSLTAARNFLTVLYDFLLAPNPESLKDLEQAAEASDNSGQGYFLGRTGLRAFMDVTLPLLRQGEKVEWARFLAGLDKKLSYAEYQAGERLSPYEKFRAISPYSDKAILTVVTDKNGDIVRMEGVEEWLSVVLSLSQNVGESVGQVLVIAMPAALPEGMDIISSESNS
jgi:hypothetical protein